MTPRKILLSISVALACGIIATTMIAADADSDTEGAKEPEQWEHLALMHDEAEGTLSGGLAKKIIGLGQKGWELVSVTTYSKDGTTTRTGYFFKRPL